MINDQEIQQALVLLATDLQYPWQVAELAEAVGLSESQFRRRFKDSVGNTPQCYLHRYRMQEARRLLATTDKPICEVAAAVGLPDPRYFRQVFQRAHRKSPTAWRAAQQEAQGKNANDRNFPLVTIE